MIRAAGLGMSMMPIMTGGLSSLPPALSSPGSAYNTLTQRVSSALGLAVLTAVATVQQAQFMADRSTLVTSAGPSVDPRIVALEHSGGEAALIRTGSNCATRSKRRPTATYFSSLGCSPSPAWDWRLPPHGKPTAVAVNRQRWVEMYHPVVLTGLVRPGLHDQAARSWHCPSLGWIRRPQWSHRPDVGLR